MRDGLPQEEIQIRIGLPWRSVEHVDGSECLSIGPTVRGDPACLSMRDGTAELGGQSVPLNGAQHGACRFNALLSRTKIQNAAVAIVERRGKIVVQLALQDRAYTAGVQCAALISECS